MVKKQLNIGRIETTCLYKICFKHTNNYSRNSMAPTLSLNSVNSLKPIGSIRSSPVSWRTRRRKPVSGDGVPELVDIEQQSISFNEAHNRHRFPNKSRMQRSILEFKTSGNTPQTIYCNTAPCCCFKRAVGCHLLCTLWPWSTGQYAVILNMSTVIQAPLNCAQDFSPTEITGMCQRK